MTPEEFAVEQWVLKATITIAATITQLDTAIALFDKGATHDGRILVRGCRRVLQQRIDDLPPLSEEFAKVTDDYVGMLEAAKKGTDQDSK